MPEPGAMGVAAARAALPDAGLSVVLAARVNLSRDLASPDREAHQAGVAYLESCVATAEALGAKIVGGPLSGAAMVVAGRPATPFAAGDRRRRLAPSVTWP